MTVMFSGITIETIFELEKAPSLNVVKLALIKYLNSSKLHSVSETTFAKTVPISVIDSASSLVITNSSDTHPCSLHILNTTGLVSFVKITRSLRSKTGFSTITVESIGGTTSCDASWLVIVALTIISPVGYGKSSPVAISIFFPPFVIE